MFMVTTASEQELSAAMDRTAEAAIDFMTARGKDLGGGETRRGGYFMQSYWKQRLTSPPEQHNRGPAGRKRTGSVARERKKHRRHRTRL